MLTFKPFPHRLLSSLAPFFFFHLPRVAGPGCSSSDLVYDFRLYKQPNAPSLQAFAECTPSAPIPVLPDGRTTIVTCAVARGAIPSNDREPFGIREKGTAWLARKKSLLELNLFFFVVGHAGAVTAPKSGNYYFLSLNQDGNISGNNYRIFNRQALVFSHNDAQPTQGMVRRRMERERSGQQVPYEVRCKAHETPCHLGGGRWECLDVLTDLECESRGADQGCRTWEMSLRVRRVVVDLRLLSRDINTSC